MKKEDQLNSVLVPLGTSIVIMTTKECLVNTRRNLTSMVEEVLYDPVIEEEENEPSPTREIDKMGEEPIKHGGPHSKKSGDSSEHLDQVCANETTNLDQVCATETKECCNDASVSCKKVLEKEIEKDVNVSIV